MNRAILAVTLCAAIAIFAVSHAGQGSTRPTEAEISAFARDAYVVVGEVPLVLPFIAFFDSSWTIEEEKKRDHIPAMTLPLGVPEPMCDRTRMRDGARYCTTAVHIEKHLMAVWSAGDWGGETAEVKVAGEGRVPVAFLRFGLR